MPQVDTNVPQGGSGPNQAEPQGAAREFAANQHAISSIGHAPGGLPQGGAPQGPPPQSPGAPGAPTQPPPQLPGQTQAADFKFDPNIARRMQGSPPWRDYLLHVTSKDPAAAAALHGVIDRVQRQAQRPS